ncbi:MAG TPA: ABC transporter ATP-binding protein [Anaerolineae bacterium]|nr:ABC transporter ATP-binding protein [Anaerolineae bacterium]
MNAIEVFDLKKYYGATRAVDGISFQVKPGEVFGLLGPNGAGKTTTVEMIEGLRPPDSGSVNVLGLDPKRDLQQIKERIGIQLQTTALYPRLTVRELIDLFASFYTGRRPIPTGDLIQLLGLSDKAATRSKDLSGGQKQRLSVALALVNNPELVFLDEPTTGLDPQARRSLWDTVGGLQKRGKTVLLTTHYMEEAETLCDRVAVIDHGKIIALDTPEALIRHHFKETAVEFNAVSAPDLHMLGALPGVSNATAKELWITLYSSDVPQTMAGLLAMSERHELKFRDLAVRNATLEDVFLKLTGRSIRD